jgi:hypothetical protein
MRKLVLAAALAAAPLFAALAGTPVTERKTCPIGGGEFDFATTASYTTWGTRPDGKPYGSWTFPLALPECPDNGLVLYKDYDETEIAKLEPLVASEAYQALRKEDTTYYRAYWLMREMGLGPDHYLWALLQASWQADDKPELRARYQAELVEGSARVEPKPDDLNWIGMEARAVNALRELGRFDEALARLDKVPTASLDVPVPAGAADSAPVRQAKQRRAWLDYFKDLRTVIVRNDATSEPFDLIPRRVSIGRCLDEADTLGEQPRAFCEKEKVAVDEMRAARDKLARETEALRQSREASGR